MTNPTSWIDVMPNVIKKAVEQGGGVIIVDTEPKRGLGEMALMRKCGNGTGVAFRVMEGADPLPQLEGAEPTAEPKDGDPCITAKPGIGARCLCGFACDNYFIRARRSS